MEGISFDITRAEMKATGYVPDPTVGGNDIVEMVNKFKIDNLYSSFPWDINFYLHVPNIVLDVARWVRIQLQICKYEALRN